MSTSNHEIKSRTNTLNLSTCKMKPLKSLPGNKVSKKNYWVKKKISTILCKEKNKLCRIKCFVKKIVKEKRL